MLKKGLTITFLSIVFAFLTPLAVVEKYNAVYAASISASDAILQPDDLGVEEPSILPTNPFYFLKKWQQDINLLFTFNKLKKVQNVLNYTLEKSLEFQKIVLSAPQNAPAIIKASNNLADGLDSLQIYTDDFKSNDGFVSAPAQKFLNIELSKGIKLKRFFDQVDKNKISSSVKKNMQKTEDKLTEIMVFAPLNLITATNDQESMMNNVQDIINSLDNAEKLELVIILNDFSTIYPNNHDAALLLKDEFIRNLENNLSKMSSDDFNKFIELNQRAISLSAQGSDIINFLSKLPADSNLNRFVIILKNNLVKNATLKFDNSTSTDVIEGLIENLMADDFYVKTDIFDKALQNASSTPKFLSALQNVFIKNQENFLNKLNDLQKDLINKSINLDIWPKNKINITTLDGEKYFIQANDLYNKNNDVDAVITLHKAQNKLESAISLAAGLKTELKNSKTNDNPLCSSDLLNIEDFCSKINGDFIINDECPALNSCLTIQPQEKAQEVKSASILPITNNLDNNNKESQTKETSPNLEANKNCSEKEVICPSLSKECANNLILQYGGNCAASFEECNINEPTCPENLKSK
jgi:hypothetical protein